MGTITVRRMDSVFERWPDFGAVLRHVFGMSGDLPARPGEAAGDEAAAAIDRCYDELAELIDLRGGPEAGPALEGKIAEAFQRLRSLQEREAQVMRQEALSRLSLPLHGGAEQLARADALLERYEGSPPHDPSADGADPQEA